MHLGKIGKIITVILITTAALFAAVVFNRITAYHILPGIFLPSYSEPTDKTVRDDANECIIEQKGRKITVYRNKKEIWKLPSNVFAQDFLFGDIDHDEIPELLILCWKRGRFGQHRPTWVKHDEIGYSQHIFIYEIEGDVVRPKWMASDIGMDATAISYKEENLLITDTDEETTTWRWNSWGLEKM